MVVYLSKKVDGQKERDQYTFDHVESFEVYKQGHSNWFFLVFENQSFKKFPCNEYRLEKVGDLIQTSFVFDSNN